MGIGKRDYIREQAVRKAVGAADNIILEASDGSTEETNYLTALVAREWFNKLMNPIHAAMLRKDIEDGYRERVEERDSCG